MELQNYSIHGKKLRNTASHSTNINIAKMVGHPTFFSFVFFCSSWLCLSLTFILRLLPSKSFVVQFLFVYITCGLPVSDRALNAPLHPPHQDQQKDTSNRYYSYFPTFKASRLRRRACDDGETIVSHQTHQI